MGSWLFRSIVTISIIVLVLGCGSGDSGSGGSGSGGSSSGGSSSGGSSGGGTGAKWTYMIYMGADNNLSSSGIGDLIEMESVGSDGNIKIALQAEFSTQYTDFGTSGYAGETLRFLVSNDNDPDTVDLGSGQGIGNVDMGSPATLTDFINWAAATYPAEHYALVLWDHGAGWKKFTAVSGLKGAIQDETSGSFMSLPNLAKAVRDSGVHLDLIDFDACLMAMYEVAYEFSGLTDYLVFSEETEPGDGNPYHTILADLKNKPAMTGAELSDTTVERYYEFYNAPETRAENVTKSAIDMSLVPELHTAMLNLSEAIVTGYDTYSTAIAAAQANAQKYEYKSNLDLKDFVSRLVDNIPNGDIRTAAQAVNTAVTNMVISNRSIGAAASNSHGLAAFVPSKGQVSSDALYDELKKYNELACNQARATVWSQAVEKIVGGAQETLNNGGFAFYIEWDTDADLDLYVWEPESIYAPWMGQATPNGYFSADSYDSGESVEYYVSNDYVQPGDYDVFVLYYEDGQNDSDAYVGFSYFDPDFGEWQELNPVLLDLSDPYEGDFSDIDSLADLNAYSNYWYAGAISRAMPEEGTVVLNAGRRNVNFHIIKKKRAPKLDKELKK